MEATKVIQEFQNLFEKYMPELMETVRKGQNYIEVPFFEISRYNPNLGEELLDNPEETFRAFELAAEQMVDSTKVKLLISELPPSCNVKIRNLRAKHLEKFWSIEGTVKRKSDVRPKVTSARFECPSCGNILTVLQLDQKFQEPTRCGCGRKGKFRLVSRELLDGYSMMIEELTEDVSAGAELKRLNCFVGGVLCNPSFESKVFQGVKIRVSGILQPFYLLAKQGGKKTQLDIFLKVNNIQILETEYEEIEISEEDKDTFHEMVKVGNVLDTLSGAMFSDVEGHDMIKKGLILQMPGGEQKILPSGYAARGDVHILLIGDPGSGKSTLLKLAYANVPKGRYVSGGGVTGVGLTATVVRDELMGGWALEAGALPLTHNGVCIIDEFDKIDKDEIGRIHEALEEQTVSIAKANVQATLRCATTVLAAANPKLGRFDISSGLYTQIDLPIPLITRFDLIFIFQDKPTEEGDKKLAEKILSRYRLIKEKPIQTTDIKKFFAYAKSFHPTMSKRVEDEITKFFVKLRNPEFKASEERRAVPISPRYIEVIRRLAESHAKLNLREKVVIEDVQVAIDMVLFTLKEIATNPETGELDVDIIDTGYSTTQRSKRIRFIEILKKLGKDKETFEYEALLDEGLTQGFSDTEIEDLYNKAKRAGEIFEPKPGRIQLMG